MRVGQLMATMLVMTASADAYFDYYSSCPGRCQELHQRCLIEMGGESDFNVECMESTSTCYSLASTTVACVSEDEATRGGAELWLKFKEHRPATTTPGPITPRPTNKPSHEWECLTWKISAITHLIISIVITTLLGVRKIVKCIRTNRYNRITHTNTDDLYRTTTQNIDEETDVPT